MVPPWFRASEHVIEATWQILPRCRIHADILSSVTGDVPQESYYFCSFSEWKAEGSLLSSQAHSFIALVSVSIMPDFLEPCEVKYFSCSWLSHYSFVSGTSIETICGSVKCFLATNSLKCRVGLEWSALHFSGIVASKTGRY